MSVWFITGTGTVRFAYRYSCIGGGATLLLPRAATPTD